MGFKDASVACRWVIPALLLVTAQLAFAELPPVVSVGSLLPADGAKADVMQLRLSPRISELTKKFQAAIAQNAEWIVEYAKQRKTGEHLPYDSRFGLTKDEYEEYLKFIDNLQLAKIGDATVKVKRDGQRITLSFGDAMPELKEVVLDLVRDTVTTPLGVATDRVPIVATEAQKATGPWDGVQWSKTEESATRLTYVKFALGKLKNSGRGILYYEGKQQTEKSNTVAWYILQLKLKSDSGDSSP